ncbi:MAG: DUF3151 domain-containing protein [Flaviflexus sp.]|nr:DUF3151 domain-containing protein [Flaviflexus sp.]
MKLPIAGKSTPGPTEPTQLADDSAIRRALAGNDPARVAADHPASPTAWAAVAETAWQAGDVLASYAYARVGYHRGLDALRAAGWRGRGPVPASHEPNRGFLSALVALRRAARAIGETAEVHRLTDFIAECDPGINPDQAE